MAEIKGKPEATKDKGKQPVKQVTEKIQKIQKFALLSPYLTYVETVPKKQATIMLHALQSHLLKMGKDSQFVAPKTLEPPVQKRQKVDSNQSYKLQPGILEAIQALKSQKQLVLGSKDVLKQISNPEKETIVFIVNAEEIAALTKHVISSCRLNAVPHVVLPRFQLPSLQRLFGVKRLTCFALVSQKASSQAQVPKSWWIDLENPDDSDLLDKVNKFTNCKPSDRLEDHKGAEDWMFK
jgi:ribosomal protein L7Ae-like RNA K-turn-binding protein